MVSEETKKKVEELRESSVEFKTVFDEAKFKIERQIKGLNNCRSYEPICSRDYYMKVKVKAFPLTFEEHKTLRKYVEEAYLGQVAGYNVYIYKCLFSNNYMITTKEPPADIEDFDYY